MAKKPIEKKPALKASSAKGKDKSKDHTADSPSKKPKRDISKAAILIRLLSFQKNLKPNLKYDLPKVIA
ncbi:hypothetical protein Tdes44962_MAKER10337, partial [Teratosphaeria destructans]